MKPSEVLPEHIATCMKMRLSEVKRIANDTTVCYRPTKIVVVKEKPREIDAPLFFYKARFRSLHRFLQRELPAHRTAHGGAKGRSCVTAARKHLNSAFLVTRDIQDCYPSIQTEPLKRRLIAIGFRSDTAWLLAQLMTLRNRIPQGSPLSCDALNLYFYQGDEKLDAHCRGWGKVTRTADDIVISSTDQRQRENAESLLEGVVAEHGLTINERKKKEVGFQPANGVQLVHGIVVNSSAGTAINTNHKQDAITAGLEYVRAAKSVSPDSLEAVAGLRVKLLGWLHYARQLRIGPAKYLGQLLQHGDRYVGKKLTSERVTRSRKWWVKTKKLNRPAKYADAWRRLISTRSIGRVNPRKSTDASVA